ncbi:MAG: chorismate mutase [Acetivibrio sp.]
MLDLNTTRDKIDKIDCDIVKLFEARMELTKEVAEYKQFLIENVRNQN